MNLEVCLFHARRLITHKLSLWVAHGWAVGVEFTIHQPAGRVRDQKLDRRAAGAAYCVWRERMGVEPTMDTAKHPSTDLKSAELTGAHSPPYLARLCPLPAPFAAPAWQIVYQARRVNTRAGRLWCS